jgi:hypothetical protein
MCRPVCSTVLILGVSSNVRKLLVNPATVSFYKKAFLLGAFQILDDLHDYDPMFYAAETKCVISKLRIKRARNKKKFFFAEAAVYGTRKVISC